jgi:hypothetical protein
MQAQLLDIPLSLVVDVLTKWLPLKDLGHLDSAQCCRSSRRTYLEILRSGSFVLPSLSKAHLAQTMQWVVQRNVKVESVKINSRSADVNPGLVASFFATVSPALRSLNVTNASDMLLPVCYAAIASGVRLKSLTVHSCNDVEDATVAILLSRTAPTLERLEIWNSNGISAFPTKCSMDKLQYLRLVQSTVDTANLCAFLASCRNLLYFYHDVVGGEDDCLHALAQSCPSLQSLHYGRASLNSTAGLDAVLQGCKDLHTIHFAVSRGISVYHINSVVQRCRRLTSFRLMPSPQFMAEECVADLTPRLRDLKHLSLVQLLCITDAAIQTLSQHCSGLRSLCLKSLVGGAHTDRALVTLFSSLPVVEEIDLSRVACLRNAVLVAIGKCCPRLHTLDLYEATGFTEEGISALAKGCPGLRCVNIAKKCPLVSKGVRSMWQAFRPALRFRTDEVRATRWIDIREGLSD